MILIGVREQQRYSREGLLIERVYLYRDNSVFYEVNNGIIKTYSYPRPFNLSPALKGVEVEDIYTPPNIELIPNIRYKERPLVHLIYGASGLGKSTLFMDISHVYETDCFPFLMEECLYSSIVVIGNRNGFTPQDIIDFFNNHQLNPLFVLVKFSLYNETNE